MRIDRFDLISFGHFNGKSLDLSKGNQGLHLIYGDNEAGKSTSLRALIAWLFGIPVRTKDNFLHGNPQLRLGGKISLLDGEELEFVRRKGAKGTLLKYGSDEVLDDAVLFSFLPAGMDEDLFKKFHGIDHQSLIAGGQELLQESGDLGQALISAAVGTAGFRKTLSDLHSNAEELFTARSSQKRINIAATNFKEAKKQIKDAYLPVEKWKKLQKEFGETASCIREVEDDFDGKTREKKRLDRCQRVKGALRERQALVDEISEMGDVLSLPEDFGGNCKMWSERLQVALEAREKAMAKMVRLEEEKTSLDVRSELLANEESILSLFKELGAVEKTVKDRPRQDGKRRLLRNEAEGLLKSVRPGLVIDEAEALRPLLNHKKWFNTLVQRHGLLALKRDRALSSRCDIQNEQERGGKERAGLSRADVDLNALKAAVAAARKGGDIEQRLAEVRVRAASARAGCDVELTRLGRFTGTVDGLKQLAMPVSETLDLFERQLAEFDEKIRGYLGKEREIVEEKRQKEQEKQTLLLTGNIPTSQELEESRNTRNIGWSLIKRKYIEDDDVGEDIAGLTVDMDLPVFYELKVGDSDRISDQLRLAADQVARRAELEANIEDLRSRLIDNTEKQKSAVAEREHLQTKWQVIWQPLGIEAGTPREMRQWLSKLKTLLVNAQFASDSAENVTKLSGDCATLRETISRQISDFDSMKDCSKLSLEEMIVFCEQRIEVNEEILEKKRRLEHLLGDLQSRLKKVNEELQVIDQEQKNWQVEWVKVINGLGLPADVHPEQATGTFEGLLSFFEKFDQSEELRRRIFGIDQVAEEFTAKVFAFADSIGFQRDGLEAIIVAAKLHGDLSRAREARAGLAKIAAQEREIRGETEEAGITIRNAEKQLARLKKMAGVVTNDALMAASEKSDKIRMLRQKLGTLEQELMRSGDGLSLKELEKESAELENDIIENELERVLAELKDLQAKRDVLRDRRQTLHNEIIAKDGKSAAATASEEAEQHRATVVSSVEHYLRLRIASLILEQKIEEYRKKNQAPVLARAGEIFTRITLGSYKGLRDELDNGKPVLLGVRPDDKEVLVEGMSDGTRDQLYLALRLATFEQHLNEGEPLPFIVDDILIGFDDNRTRVCLDVLAELAQTTQVLLFTHNQRVIEIAESMIVDAGIFVHNLSESG